MDVGEGFISWLTDIIAKPRRYDYHINTLRGEVDHYVAAYRREADALIKAGQELEQLKRDSRSERLLTETTINTLQRRLDESEHSRRFAEDRVSDLRETLRIERERFDKAIDREREVDDGMRARIGLMPRPDGANGTAPQPVSTRRAPWSSVETKLTESERTAIIKKTPENDAKADHWREKIKKAESETEIADASRSGNNTEEGHSESPTV